MQIDQQEEAVEIQRNLFKRKMFTEKNLFHATNAYHKFDKMQNMQSNTTFVISALDERKNDKRQKSAHALLKESHTQPKLIRKSTASISLSLDPSQSLDNKNLSLNLRLSQNTNNTHHTQHKMTQDAASRWLDSIADSQHKSVKSNNFQTFEKSSPTNSRFAKQRSSDLYQLVDRQTGLEKVTGSINKLKMIREEACNWTTLDQNLNQTSRGSSKVFPTRLQTADPMSFQQRPCTTKRTNIQVAQESKRLNILQRQQYSIKASDGAHKSSDVNQVLHHSVSYAPISISSQKYQPITSLKSLATNPELFVPKSASKVNFMSQKYDFITHGKAKELANQIASEGKCIKTKPYNNYNISKIVEDQRLSNPKYRDQYSAGFNKDHTIFRKSSGSLALHLDASKLAITRPSHINAFVQSARAK